MALTALPFTAMAAETEKPSTDKSYKVVFEVSIDGAEIWQSALRKLENTRRELGEGTKIDVVVVVVKASDKFEVLGANKLDSPINATPALANGRVYIRTEKMLWALGSKSAPVP